MNCSRKLHLVAPIGAEELWQRLATILSSLVKLYARRAHQHSTHVVVGPELPPVEGPRELPSGDRRYYRCSELGVSATSDLTVVVKDGHSHRSVVSATVSQGLFVCQPYSSTSPSTTEPIDKLNLECNDDAVDEVVAFIRSAVDIRDVTRR